MMAMGKFSASSIIMSENPLSHSTLSLMLSDNSMATGKNRSNYGSKEKVRKIIEEANFSFGTGIAKDTAAPKILLISQITEKG